MSTKLLSRRIWPKITSAAVSSAASANVAVAYFGAGASKMLPIREGSRLVVDFSQRAVKSGQTCPSEILKLIGRGVDVYSVSNLHAKMFVFRNRAFVGSCNVSHTSATGLVEAVIDTTDRKLIGEARRFVRRLCVDWVTLHQAKQMVKLYKKPMFGRGGGTNKALAGTSSRVQELPDYPSVKVADLTHESWNKEVRRAEKRGREKARKRIRDTRHFLVDDFRIHGRCRFKLHDTVVQVTKVAPGMKLVSPKGKVIQLEDVPNQGEKQTLVFVEIPRKCRRKSLETVVGRLGTKARAFLNRDRVIRDRFFIEKLSDLWTRPRGNTE